jgi:PIN domain nuclease of toxin-antitoxin system
VSNQSMRRVAGPVSSTNRHGGALHPDRGPVTATEARDSARLPRLHLDPFDRVLVAQARRRGLQLATRDPLLSQYEVPILTV